jgi:6-phosphogluconolactonase (cycloisomerase 2 family)
MMGGTDMSLVRLALASTVAIFTVANAAGQSAQRAAFVSNDGNLQGSVTSFTFDADGMPTLVDFLITGQKESSADFHPGTNAYAIDITPNGEFLAVAHATGNPPPGFPAGRRITMIRVHEDATMTIHATFQVPSTPLDLKWINDEYIAIAETNFGGLNRVWIYRFDAETNELIFRDAKITGSFSSSLAVSPDQKYIYANDSTGFKITVFEINDNFTLTELQAQSTGNTYPLGMGVSPNGKWIYGGGGISSGGKSIIGFDINENSGMLSLIPNAPFQSPGSSPKQIVVSSDSTIAVAGHGTDATVRTFLINQATGQLTSTGHFMSAGSQGSLGNIAILDELLLVADRNTFSDGVQGLHCLTLHPDGSITPNGAPIPTQGISANDIAVWSVPLCPADLTGDGQVNVSDLLVLLGAWGPCDGECPSDLNGDGQVNVSDLLVLLAAWGSCN